MSRVGITANVTYHRVGRTEALALSAEAEVWIGSLDGAVSKALLKGVSQTMYADGHLLLVQSGRSWRNRSTSPGLKRQATHFRWLKIFRPARVETWPCPWAERSPRLSGRDAANDYDLVWFDRAGVQGATLGSAYLTET